jgi:hypothetical protein
MACSRWQRDEFRGAFDNRVGCRARCPKIADQVISQNRTKAVADDDDAIVFRLMQVGEQFESALANVLAGGDVVGLCARVAHHASDVGNDEFVRQHTQRSGGEPELPLRQAEKPFQAGAIPGMKRSNRRVLCQRGGDGQQNHHQGKKPQQDPGEKYVARHAREGVSKQQSCNPVFYLAQGRAGGEIGPV